MSQLFGILLGFGDVPQSLFETLNAVHDLLNDFVDVSVFLVKFLVDLSTDLGVA